MMTEEQRIEWLLELQEHPEELTDEKLRQILADEEMRQLVQQLSFAKRAFKHDELTDDTPDVDAEWEKFVKAHPPEAHPQLGHTQRGHNQQGHTQLAHPLPLPKGGESQTSENKRKRVPLPWGGDRGGPDRGWLPRGWLPGGGPIPYHKVAASFIGVLLVSGIAFAAIQIVRNINTSKPQLATTEQAPDIEPGNSLVADTIKTETIPSEPYVFNNVPLDSMLTAIAAAHGVQVEFENESARQLRFHFIWKREDSLDRIVEKLNTFEAVNIGVEDKKLVVR